MAKNTSTQIREFVKNALKSYYDNFLVKLSDIAKKDDVNPAIKINNDGSVYIYDLGNYNGSSVQNASSLLSVIKNIGGSSGNIAAGNNIQIDTDNTISTISALGYTYNKNASSFAEGMNTTASGTASHAEGYYTTASGSASHAEGAYSNTIGTYSHAEGLYTTTSNEAEHAEGKYNISNPLTIHSIGIGSSNQSKNALEVLNDGSIFITGLVTTNSYNGTSITNVSTLQDVINEKIDKNAIFAPTTRGNRGLFLVSNGIKPIWATVNINDAIPRNVSSYTLYTPTNSGASGLLLMSNGLGAPTWITVSINGIISTRDFSLYTPTNSGEMGLFLMSTGLGAPVWRTLSNAEPSDERLKNIKSELSVEDCYKLINDCSTIIYSLKTDEKDQNQIGMIAQLVKEFIPEVVQESNGYYSINYSRLSVVALNLIKNLSKRIIELEKDHNKLEELIKRIETLENK